MIKELTNTSSFPLGKWILTNFLGWFIGVVLVLGIVILFDTLGIEGVQFFVGTGMALGLGFFQQRMLKRWFDIGHRWVLYTVIGLTTPFIGLDVINAFGNETTTPYFLPVCVGLAGLLIGIGQARLLKPLQISKPTWVGISLISWLLAGLSVYSIEFTMSVVPNPKFTFAVNLGLILIGGIIHGICTGIFLMKRLTRLGE